jgi:hypothetical protein
MASNDYHFVTRWRVQGTPEEVYDVLQDARGLVRWWPSVYLDVEQLEPGDEQGVGNLVRLYTRGRLPYTLRWTFRTVGVHRPDSLTIRALGDFEGEGVWTIEQDGAWTDVAYDWRIRAEKPLLRRLSVVLKPVFAWNHRWAMARGEESLKLELLRRRAVSADDRAGIPNPPGPASDVPFLAAGALVGGLAVGFVLTRVRSLRD